MASPRKGLFITMRTLIYLLLFAIIGSAIFYFSMQNSAPASVTLYGDIGLKNKPIAAFVLGSAFIGALLTFLLGTLGRIGGFFKTRSERKKHENIVRHHQALVSGREFLAAGDFSQAKGAFSRLFEEDTKDLLASSMLAETLFKQGEYSDALKVVDKARQSQKDNIELLFLGSDINKEMGNLTAAYDNLSLVLKQQPKNIPALQKIIDLALPLKRFDEAIDYQNRLIKLVDNEQRSKAQNNLADIELEKAQLTANREGSDLKPAVESVLKKHRNHGPSLAALAELEAKNGDTKAAAKLLSRAYQSDFNSNYLDKIADILIAVDEPSRALDIVKKCVQNCPKEAEIKGRIALLNILLRLEMLEEAKESYDLLLIDCPSSHPDRVQLDVAGAELTRKTGNTEDAFIALKGAIRRLGLPAPTTMRTSSPSLPWNG